MISEKHEFAYPAHVMFQASAAWSYAREPVLARMPDGSLVAALYAGGPTEPHDENVVLGVRSDDGGRTWSAPVVWFDHATRGTWATEIFTAGERPCLFVHTLDAASHYLELHTYQSFTSDSGRTWTEPVSLPSASHCVSVRQGVVLQDGTWLLPVYWQEAGGGWNWEKHGPKFQPDRRRQFCCGVLRSRDGGRNWTAHGRLRADLNLWEPAVAETAPGRLVMLLRAEGVPVKYRADSTDGGLTWTVPRPTDLPDANSKITLLRHENAIFLFHNPSAQPGWRNRKKLEVWVSRDGCRTWPVRCLVARAVHADCVVCYPHGFIDPARGCISLALDTKEAHYYMEVPLAALGC